MIIEQLQFELCIETDNFEELSEKYANLIISSQRNKIFKVDWLRINNRIIEKYNYETLEQIKHEAWSIVEERKAKETR